MVYLVPMAEIIFRIEGRPISKKNSRRNFGKVSLPSIGYVKFEKLALAQLEAMQIEPLLGPVRVKYRFCMKGRLDSDVDNMIAGINDILQKAGIIENDSLILEGSFIKQPLCPDWQTILEIKQI